MKCSECGAEIREGALYCDVCGAEVRIVPDYSPLDEVLTAHVRGEINGRIERSGESAVKRESENGSRANGHGKHHVDHAKQKQKKKKKNKKKKMIWILAALLALIFLGMILFRNSYGGLLQRGNNAMADQRYNAAYKYFEQAAKKKPKRAEAYVGLAKVYLAQDNPNDAELVYLSQIDAQPDNADIYKATAEFYVEMKQTDKIPVMLDHCSSEAVLSKMSDYMVSVPIFSLSDGTYEEVQKLELSSDENNEIYYTLDESEPTAESGTKYGTEIELDEKEWVIKAICVNEMGIPSLVETRKVTVELPISDPPMVSPSSGLYEEKNEITIQVPEGFTAYYVFGSTEPTKENWTKYEGPIAMPEGNKIFSAVLMENDTGKISAATVRNYDLKLNVPDAGNENM